ncbi:maleylpyruvate isomerase family mycothiol-dependent enzyme [Amycolatopsis alkalitolerans]|uniref:Maleylpyruvate isomerase family mycothiol-dependent enzyme n=1 Tax=Amycolatopsis alkalitolerans TaxID=2547244 RepID=A0A5C4M689_9PSEU|nr:maleylpyruvate isomerase family mycothiol-dependent enzyme [Amycolatopsis alkalitolerans]TNC28785.1 maleylpyruvate isomerase family mycothiol-dependent enzyme [Amycolatopsis alkalitolerans]
MIRTQGDAMRSAVVTAGPDAEVPTCPRWTVSRLVGHLGRVQSWVIQALADPSGREIKPDRPPEGWDELLAWWDEQRTKMLDGLADPDAPAWLPFTRYPRVAASWARRQAHEAAIHRLDAEHALSAEPSVGFDPEFAADGVDELIAWMVPTRTDWADTTYAGTVRLSATDIERDWTVRLSPGAPPSIDESGAEADLTITGSADAVYRRVWGRPSQAVVTGDTALLKPLASP